MSVEPSTDPTLKCPGLRRRLGGASPAPPIENQKAGRPTRNEFRNQGFLRPEFDLTQQKITTSTQQGLATGVQCRAVSNAIAKFLIAFCSSSEALR